MINMTVDVEFIAGTDIKEAVKQAKQKCEEWGVVYIKFNFNGVRMSIGANCDIERAVEDYVKALSSDNEHKYVVNNG